MGKTKPTLTGDNGPTPHITIRVPPAELAKWKERADKAGMSLSAWIRQTLNKARK